MNSSGNKLILRNTIIIYVRMIIVMFVGLFSSRFVLQALGVSDYGLYNVVAGLIAMLNFVSTALSTTTRRYINIEMGTKDGNLNKVFNVCLLLHLGFALVILIIADTIGTWYVLNILNVTPGKEGDAMLVFQISTIVACIGLINIPYQSLLEAFEDFSLTAIIDIASALIKFGLVIAMLYYNGNSLRFYAICMCLVMLFSFVAYHIVCYKKWPDVIKHKLYKKNSLYKEILVFNNYTALGALATIGKAQGGNLLINYFFGTVVNGAFAIAHQVDSYVYMFVNKLTLASNPQIAKNYSGGDLARSNTLVEKNSKYSILIMTVFYFSLVVDMDFILECWLGIVPVGASLLCILTLSDALVRSFSEGTNGYIQASGKIKWFQILSTILLLINLPIAFFLFKLGFEPFWVIVCYIVTSLLYRGGSLIMMTKILSFDTTTFIRKAYLRPISVIIILALICIIINRFSIEQYITHLGKILAMFTVSLFLTFQIGLEREEKDKIISFVLIKIMKKVL